MFFPLIVNFVAHAVEAVHLTALHGAELATFATTLAMTFKTMAKH